VAAGSSAKCLGKTEWQFVNATMAQTPTSGQDTANAGRNFLVSERLGQFLKFCLVGGSGTVVDMTVLYLLADPGTLALDLTRSKVVAAEVALINNFLWNEFWTFKAAGRARHSVRADWTGKDSGAQRTDAPCLLSPRLHRLLFFNAICGMGILFAVLLLHLFHTRLGWNLYLSNLLTIGLVTLWNFGMNAKFNWQAHGRSG